MKKELKDKNTGITRNIQQIATTTSNWELLWHQK